MSRFTDRLYVQWLDSQRRDGARVQGFAIAREMARLREERASWLADALEAGARWRSARQRPAIAGNSSGIAGPSSPSVEVLVNGQS